MDDELEPAQKNIWNARTVKIVRTWLYDYTIDASKINSRIRMALLLQTRLNYQLADVKHSW
jgi:hypothetical protein